MLWLFSVRKKFLCQCPKSTLLVLVTEQRPFYENTLIWIKKTFWSALNAKQSYWQLLCKPLRDVRREKVKKKERERLKQVSVSCSGSERLVCFWGFLGSHCRQLSVADAMPAQLHISEARVCNCQQMPLFPRRQQSPWFREVPWGFLETQWVT